MFECPVVYFEKNLIFDSNKQCWGVFKIDGFNYDFLAEEKKLEILGRLARLLSSVREAKILMIPIHQDLEVRYRNIVNNLRPGALYEYARNHAEVSRAYLKQLAAGGVSNDYEFYLIVKLVNNGDQAVLNKARHFFELAVKDPVNTLHTYFGLDTKDLMESEVRLFEKLSHDFLTEQSKRIRLEAATPHDIQRLLKRVTCRGREQDIQYNLTKTRLIRDDGSRETVISDWVPYAQRFRTVGGNDTVIRPFNKQAVNLFRGEISLKRPRRLKIRHDDGTALYQAFLVITHIPDMLEFPGSEWLYLLQRLNCQCEVCIHWQNIEFRESLRKLDMKKREINSQYENITEANADVPEDLMTSREQVELLEGELKNDRAPLCKACVSVCLSDTDPEALEEKARHVRQVYEDMNFIVERPAADQYNLFMQHIPGGGMYTKDFNMILPPSTLAGGIIGASTQLGDDAGPYIGTVGAGKKPVFLSMGLACLMDMSAAAVFYGNLGYGKSFNANLMIYLTVLYGGYGLVIDPKGERGHWAETLPLPRDYINIVTLAGDDENAGKLDPFVVYRHDFAAAAELAQSVLAELLKLKPQDPAYILLSETIGRMKGTEKPSLARLIRLIDEVPKNDEFYKEAVILSRSIKSQGNAGLSRLLIGTGEEEAIKIDGRLNVIQVQNLKMPSPETPKESYSQDETLSTVIFMVIGSFAKQFALARRPVFSQILFDESWMLGKTVEGVKLFEYLTRMGRSLYTGCIFNGHSVLDIPNESIRNTVTYVFCFHTDSTAEAKRMLELLEMDVTEENIKIIKGLKNRQCLFKDVFKRVGVLTFDCVTEDLAAAFSTTPKTEDEPAPKAEGPAPTFGAGEALRPPVPAAVTDEGRNRAAGAPIDIWEREEV